jgi:metal-responsive CopG/Arc/MetJ family transcriptional regulator
MVKIAISLDEALFRDAESTARRMKVSRSRLFATAMAEFLERRRNLKLLDALNTAYGAPPSPSERRLARARRAHHARLVRGEW